VGFNICIDGSAIHFFNTGLELGCLSKHILTKLLGRIIITYVTLIASTQPFQRGALATIVTSCFDHNALFYGLPLKIVHKLQLVQNSAVQILTRTSTMEQICWLPVTEYGFKTLLLVYKALDNLAPSYLSDLLSTHSRTLRSSSTFSLVLPSHLFGFYEILSF